MKKFLTFSLAALVALLFCVGAQRRPIYREDSDIRNNTRLLARGLYGRIQFVKAGEDVCVKIVDTGADLCVKTVYNKADRPGLWQVVHANPDFRVRVVDGAEHMTVSWHPSSFTPPPSR